MSAGYNFTERVRKVLALSREEAARRDHGDVSTEHILLGLMAEGEGVGSAVLANLGADPEDIRAAIDRHLEGRMREERPGGAGSGPDLPYSEQAKKSLELGMVEARELNHSYVGTEHLLLGLLGEGRGIASQVLGESGVTLEAARAETLRLLGTAVITPDKAPAAAGPSHANNFLTAFPIGSGSPEDVMADFLRAVKNATGGRPPGAVVGRWALGVAIAAFAIAVVALVVALSRR